MWTRAPKDAPREVAAGAAWPRDPLLTACTLLLAVAAFLLADFGVADSDLFWHLRQGYRILESGGVPSVDAYSHTATGEHYAYYSWLAEVPAALLHRLGGFELVVLAKAAGCALLFLLLAAACRLRGGRGLAVAWALLGALLLVRFRLYARPEIFTLVLLVAVDLLVHDYLRRGRRRNLLLLPLVFALWANLHPYVLVGLVVLAVHCLGEAAGRRLRRPTAGGRGSPLLLGAAAVSAGAATLLNPYGAGIYTPAFKLYAPGAIADLPTREWLPPTPEHFLLFFLLAPLATLVVVLTLRRARLQDLAVWGLLLAGAFASLRNIGIFAVATAPILARHLTFASEAAGTALRRRAPTLSRWLPRPSRAAVLAVAVVWATAVLLSPAWSILHQDQSRHYRFGAGLARYSAPVEAVEFIEEHRLQGPLYNSWALGGYVIWRSWPRLQVSLDGRQMLYEGFLGELGQVGLEPMLGRLDVRLGLAEFHDQEMIRAFRAGGDFRLVFFDDVAMVFLRSDAVGASIHPYEVLRPEDLSMSWLHGHDEAALGVALQEAERATRDSPDSSRAWMILGSLARRAADLPRSLEALERAIALDPTQKSYHNNLGIALLESGRAGEALDALDIAVRLDPWAFEAHYNSGLALVEMGRERAALRSFRRALRRHPDRAEAHVMLGALEPDRARAREHLRRGIELARQPDLVRRARELLAELDGGEN